MTPPGSNKPVARGSTQPVVKPTDAAPADPDIAGVNRRANETPAEYAARARRVQENFAEGKRLLEKQDFTAAIAQFRAVQSNQPGYQGVEALVTQATDGRRAAVEQAISNGQQNEKAGELRAARLWYRKALDYDASSASAREKDNTLMNRMLPEANKIYAMATAAEKLSNVEAARRQYQEVMDKMLIGDEIYDRARKAREALNP